MVLEINTGSHALDARREMTSTPEPEKRSDGYEQESAAALKTSDEPAKVALEVLEQEEGKFKNYH